MPWHDHEWNSGAGWVVMLVLMLLLLAITVAAVVWAAKATTRRSSTHSPEQTLAERFARGEIDAEEYQRRSALLRAER